MILQYAQVYFIFVFVYSIYYISKGITRLCGFLFCKLFTFLMFIHS